MRSNSRKLHRTSITILVSLLSVCLLSSIPVFADTFAGGAIRFDTTWTAANSPYIVIQNIVVEEGVTLTINAGVTVKFDDGYEMVVSGQLKTRGTASMPILLTSNSNNPTNSSWGSIIFANQAVGATYTSSGDYISGSIIEWTQIEYSEGISVSEAMPFISHVTMTNNNYIFKSRYQPSCVEHINIYDSTFLDNGGIDYISSYGCHPLSINIKNSIFRNVYPITVNSYEETSTITFDNCILDNVKPKYYTSYSLGDINYIFKNSIIENTVSSPYGFINNSDDVEIHDSRFTNNDSVLFYDHNGNMNINNSIFENRFLTQIGA